MAPTIRQFEQMSDDEIMELAEKRCDPSVTTPQFILEELSRRATDRISRSMLRLTWIMTLLTALVFMLTCINVLLVWQATGDSSPARLAQPLIVDPGAFATTDREQSGDVSVATNQEVAEELARMLQDADVHGTDMEIMYQQGRVELAGQMASLADKDSAVEVVRQHPSVDTVEDRMTVKQ